MSEYKTDPPSAGDYARERDRTPAGATRAANAAFQVNNTHRETMSRLSDITARLRNLTIRIVGVLPPSKLDNEKSAGITSGEPDNLVGRFRSCDRDMNRSMDHMQEYLSTLEEQL